MQVQNRETERDAHRHVEKGMRKKCKQERDLRETVKMSQVEMSAARWRGVKLSKSKRLKP